MFNNIFQRKLNRFRTVVTYPLSVLNLLKPSDYCSALHTKRYVRARASVCMYVRVYVCIRVCVRVYVCTCITLCPAILDRSVCLPLSRLCAVILYSITRSFSLVSLFFISCWCLMQPGGDRFNEAFKANVGVKERRIRILNVIGDVIRDWRRRRNFARVP